MPQMSPLNWLILFILFTVIYLLFMSINYFMFNYNKKYFLMTKTYKKNNWKW